MATPFSFPTRMCSLPASSEDRPDPGRYSSEVVTNGNVYIVWQDGRNLQVPDFDSGFYGYADVLLRSSSDGGSTWSPAVRVNNNPDPVPGGGGTDQYQPGVAVDKTGEIGVCWYDRRLDPLNYMIDRFCGVSHQRWCDIQKLAVKFAQLVADSRHGCVYQSLLHGRLRRGGKRFHRSHSGLYRCLPDHEYAYRTFRFR